VCKASHETHPDSLVQELWKKELHAKPECFFFTPKLTGLSLSLCIAAIVRGEVSLDDVQYIIARTAIKTEDHLTSVIERYKQGYWSDNPELGERITRELFAEDKIIQPRLLGCEPYPTTYGIWILGS